MMHLFAPKHLGEDVPKLYGRNSILAKIQDYIVDKEVPENIAILGVKGAGKTSLIKNAFCKAANKKYYEESKVVVAFVSIPETTDSMKGFYSYLNMALLEGLDAVEEYDAGKYESIMTQVVEKKNKILSRSVEVDDATMEAVLNKTIEIVQSFGLKLLVVFDDFERFADSSNLKKAQYKFMRELANSGRISLYISTGQDLTKVSEEMKGSGFENIFTYEELRGIRSQDIEDWVWDVTDDTDVEFDDDCLEWIEEVSGGIPELVGEAAELAYRLLEQEEEFETESFTKKLYPIVYPLMKKWWMYTDNIEHCILGDMLAGKTENSINRDCLVKKGYLTEGDNGEVGFTSPMFRMYVEEELRKENDAEPESREKAEEQTEDIRNLLTDIIKEANKEMREQIDTLEGNLSDIKEQLSLIQQDMPSKEDYYKEDSGELDLAKYEEAIVSYISDKLTATNDQDICDEWKIEKEFWEKLSDIRRSDCALAYRLHKLVFAEKNAGLDYTPVTVMLGNFLEGMLNDCVLRTLKKRLPNVKVKQLNGSTCSLADFRGTMTIGGFSYIFKNEDVSSVICTIPKAKELRLSPAHISDFTRKLSECHTLRNKADHPGETTSFEDKKKFVENMFLGNSSMVSMMSKLQIFG